MKIRIILFHIILALFIISFIAMFITICYLLDWFKGWIF